MDYVLGVRQRSAKPKRSYGDFLPGLQLCEGQDHGPTPPRGWGKRAKTCHYQAAGTATTTVAANNNFNNYASKVNKIGFC